MTDDAIRRQKADLLLEHKEAEDYPRDPKRQDTLSGLVAF